jgi:pyruvate carboxylase
MAGLCKPNAAYELVKTLREEIEIPVHFHTHDTSGVNAASILMAAEGGVDVADAAIAAMSGGCSQPNLNSLVAALRRTSRDTGLDLEALNDCSDYWETVRAWYLPFDSGPRTGSAHVYEHEIPGGQYTNLREQAQAMGLGHRWLEVERTYGEVNQLFGDIVKVTPSSKVVGDMALFLMANDIKPADVLKLDEHHSLALPTSVVEMFAGALGTPDGGWPPKVQRIILRGTKPKRGRPGASLKRVDFRAAQQALEKKLGRGVAADELISALLYPEVFGKYAAFRKTYADVSVLPTPAFFYGLRPDEEISVEIESGKSLIIKFLTAGEPHPDGTRTLFFELNGQSREVRVRDYSLQITARTHPKADASDPGQVAAPASGVITGIAVHVEQVVQRGAKLLVLDAMKMQSNLSAPIAGRVTRLLVAANQRVEAKDLLLTIAPLE